jgi:hypothetical protein
MNCVMMISRAQPRVAGVLQVVRHHDPSGSLMILSLMRGWIAAGTHATIPSHACPLPGGMPWLTPPALFASVGTPSPRLSCLSAMLRGRALYIQSSHHNNPGHGAVAHLASTQLQHRLRAVLAERDRFPVGVLGIATLALLRHPAKRERGLGTLSPRGTTEPGSDFSFLP